MKIPLANPARELKKIKNFQPRFNKKLNQGVYVGGKDVTTFEENIASIGLEEIYYKLIDTGLNTALFEAEEDYYNSNDVVDFRYVKIPFNSISDSLIKVKKSDVTNYIEQNKNDFSSDPTRDLIFVKFDESPSANDELDAKLSLNSLIESIVIWFFGFFS